MNSSPKGSFAHTLGIPAIKGLNPAPPFRLVCHGVGLVGLAVSLVVMLDRDWPRAAFEDPSEHGQVLATVEDLVLHDVGGHLEDSPAP